MKLLRILSASVIALTVITIAAIYLMLRMSLPQLDGTLTQSEIQAPVTIERDAQGIVEITGKTRADIAFALGFTHAQERFFQMDLQRRNAAGELSALFGEAALNHDRQVRLHRFRARAQRNLQHYPSQAVEILNAYSKGVNFGLDSLPAAPFEYTLLGQAPSPWQPEDSILTVFSMILVLQDDQGWFERTRGIMAESLPADLYAFFTQQGGQWDAPLIESASTGTTLPPAPIPSTGWSDLMPESTAMRYVPMVSEDVVVGSNNWAVSGALSKHGGAMIADDMHLAIRVPNIWFRAQWQHPDTGRLVSGATLPGTPLVVAGSNGKLAWGFTNTQGDWSDVILLELNDSKDAYKTAQGWKPFERFQESIHIKDRAAQTVEVRETQWGPVIGEDPKGRLLVLKWTAHDITGANMGPYVLESVESVHDALKLGPSFGMPHQNLVMADDSGAIGWTVAGPFPKRVGTDGRLPESWSDGSRSWQGIRGLDEHPVLATPAHQRLWTANARTLSDDAFKMMGDSAYALGARQQQIRDDLFAADRFDEKALLDIQLDDKAVFLTPWRDHLLQRLSRKDITEPSLIEAKTHLEQWTARAEVDSVGYRLVREFRLKTIEYLTAPLISYMQTIDPDFDLAKANRQIEYPAWSLIQTRPTHLLNPDFSSWDELELFAIKAVVEPLYEDASLADNTWGEANKVIIEHPMARFVSPIKWFMSMPHEPLNGDTHMPRVQTPTHGASERFVVSPGKESEGIFHMATGQSAHPLSPFFGNGHRDWVEGKASPWLKAETQYSLTIQP
ncbi:penicillin acylase family protein [Simiduia litorea]|uniref:penicillin acylase family protein n=1 Tax=Simiduia litorea TaxID=1435348 RepID=UPI0036F3F609